MARIKNTSRSEFKKMSFDEKKKELKRMAKRANVRIALLEEKGLKNDSYNFAIEYNKDRKNNRFYEGVKYDNHKEIDKQFKALHNFLADKTSTLTGARQKVSDEIKDIVKRGNLNINTFSKMSKQEKLYASSYASKLANTRLKSLENKMNSDDAYKGYTKFAYQLAEHYNNVNGREKNRYYTGTKFKNDNELETHLQEVGHFLSLPTSTVKGVNEIVNNRIKTFRNKGVKIDKGKEKEFIDFLSSKQFDKLKQYADSDQIIETFNEARDVGQEVDEINQAFIDFMNGELDFTEVQERLQVAKWQNKLFH